MQTLQKRPDLIDLINRKNKEILGKVYYENILMKNLTKNPTTLPGFQFKVCNLRLLLVK